MYFLLFRKNADKNVLSLSYGANYFNIRTNENSFVVPFDEITVIYKFLLCFSFFKTRISSGCISKSV